MYGIPAALLAGFLFGEGEHLGTFAMSLFFQFAAMISMLPAAVLGNFVALRVFGWRSWRHERWRARVAGILAIPVAGVGTVILWTAGRTGPPTLLRDTLGGWAAPLYFLACVVTFSNLCLLAAWVWPPRKTFSRE